MDHIEGELHSNALAVSENSETSIGRMLQELCVTLDPNVDVFFLEKSRFLTPPPPLPLVLGFLIANFEYDRPHPLRFFSKKKTSILGSNVTPPNLGGPNEPPPPSPFRNGRWGRPG